MSYYILRRSRILGGTPPPEIVPPPVTGVPGEAEVIFDRARLWPDTLNFETFPHQQRAAEGPDGDCPPRDSNKKERLPYPWDHLR